MPRTAPSRAKASASAIWNTSCPAGQRGRSDGSKPGPGEAGGSGASEGWRVQGYAGGWTSPSVMPTGMQQPTQKHSPLATSNSSAPAPQSAHSATRASTRPPGSARAAPRTIRSMSSGPVESCPAVPSVPSVPYVHTASCSMGWILARDPGVDRPSAGASAPAAGAGVPGGGDDPYVMSHRMMLLRRAASAAALLVTVLPVTLASPAHADGSAPSCRAPASVPLDAEQARLTDPRTTALVERAGFGDFVRRFPAALCTTRTAAEAERLLDSWGQALWQASVRRAQGQRPGGDLAPGDDRPLYWARLSMTAALARWQPAFAVDRAALRVRFEDASRGLLDNAFRATPGVRRVFVSGFDPFGLDAEIRRANPSGSAALQFNGRHVTLADGSRAEIRAVVLPVRYADFDAGIVERAFTPRLAAGPAPADIITTVSQGYPGIFTLEDWAGRARSADPYPDNAR
ncbi:secreted protein, partial [Streptomyces sp. C]